MTSSTPPSQNNDLDLLDRTHKVMKAEQKLTALLERVDPWLGNPGDQSAVRNHYSTRVRPIPQTMDQVENILSLARSWASKTSAPAGWDPSAPVIGFATPNPLPHHLRGGALAALQLERATKEKFRASKLKEEERESKAQAAKEEKEELERQKQLEQQQSEQTAEAQSKNPKKRMRAENSNSPKPQQRPAQQRQPSVGVSMNLSDSSSEEESEEDDDEMSE